MSYLIERPGAKDSLGGMLSVLKGAAPVGLNANDYKPGLDYYDQGGNKANMSSLMVQGDKGFYNLAAIWGRDPKTMADPKAFLSVFKGDQTATDAVQKTLSAYAKQQQIASQSNGGYSIGQAAGASGAPAAGILQDQANARSAATSVLQAFVGPESNGTILGQPQPNSQHANAMDAISIAKAENMPRFTSMEDAASGGAAQMANARSRKVLGKPGGFGAPVFNVLSGAPASDTLLGA